jgi:hypothetical protein
MSSFIAQGNFPSSVTFRSEVEATSLPPCPLLKKADPTHQELVRSQNFVTAPLSRSLILKLNLEQSVTTVAVIFL